MCCNFTKNLPAEAFTYANVEAHSEISAESYESLTLARKPSWGRREWRPLATTIPMLWVSLNAGLLSKITQGFCSFFQLNTLTVRDSKLQKLCYSLFLAIFPHTDGT